MTQSVMVRALLLETMCIGGGQGMAAVFERAA